MWLPRRWVAICTSCAINSKFAKQARSECSPLQQLRLQACVTACLRPQWFANMLNACHMYMHGTWLEPYGKHICWSLA
jgi:hypothetical protein